MKSFRISPAFALAFLFLLAAALGVESAQAQKQEAVDAAYHGSQLWC